MPRVKPDFIHRRYYNTLMEKFDESMKLNRDLTIENEELEHQNNELKQEILLLKKVLKELRRE